MKIERSQNCQVLPKKEVKNWRNHTSLTSKLSTKLCNQDRVIPGVDRYINEIGFRFQNETLTFMVN